MAIRYYDEALVEKIKKWVKDPDLQILKPDETTRYFEMKLDQTKDQPLHLPLISITRDRSIEILNLQKQPKTFSGFIQSTDKTVTIPMNVIPIQVNYQIDIYTKGIQEADEYIRNFIFNFINYPKLRINLPYNNLNIEHESTIHLDSSITDNSDIKEHLFADEFVRFTLKLSIDDAYLFSLPKTTTASLEIDGLYVWDKYDRKSFEGLNEEQREEKYLAEKSEIIIK